MGENDLAPTGGDLVTSRVGLGCGSLHHLLSHKQRQAILQAALDQGIRHFDCARMYGNGLAEREVGVLAKHRRSEMTIASKFGIPASAFLEKFSFLQFPAKAARRILALAGLRPQTYFASDRFSEAEAERNLAASLRATQTSDLDILFLHEPQPHELDRIFGLNEWAERKRQAGLIRHFGLAGTHAIALAAKLPGSPWQELLQAPINWRSYADPHAESLCPRFVYGLYTYPPANRQNSQANLLRTALMQNHDQTILISTTKIAHLTQASQVMHEVESGIGKGS